MHKENCCRLDSFFFADFAKHVVKRLVASKRKEKKKTKEIVKPRISVNICLCKTLNTCLPCGAVLLSLEISVG